MSSLKSQQLSEKQLQAKNKKYDESIKKLAKQVDEAKKKFDAAIQKYQQYVEACNQAKEANKQEPKPVQQPFEAEYILNDKFIDELINHIYENFDFDKNQKLDSNEAHDAFYNTSDALQLNNLCNSSIFMNMFKQADTDNDGMLTKKELKDFFKKYHKELVEYAQKGTLEILGLKSLADACFTF